MKVSYKKSSPSSVVSASSTEDFDDFYPRDLVLQKEQPLNANSVPRKRASPRRLSDVRSKPAPVRAFVEHHYHDHARDPLANAPELVGPRSDSAMSRSFPEKLHSLLDAMDEEGQEHIASWQPHGRCFVVHDKAEFVRMIMPRFFLQTKLTSFQRQLNLYGTSSSLCDWTRRQASLTFPIAHRIHSSDGRRGSRRVCFCFRMNQTFAELKLAVFV